MSTSVPVIRRGLLFLFALPGVLQGFMSVPGQSILQGVYAKESGIALITLGAVVLFVRIFDCISDLLIGYGCDVTAGRRGGRKAWMAAGTVVAVVSMWFLFRPPQDVGAFYFGFWFLLANVGWSLVEIPYRSWSLELSSDYAQRARIQTWLAMALMAGVLLFYLTPYLAEASGATATTEITMATLGFGALLMLVLLPPLNAVALLRVPTGDVLPEPAQADGRSREGPRELLASVLGNRPLMAFIGCFLLTMFCSGLQQGVSFLYYTNYLGLTTEFTAVAALSLPASFLAIPFWGALAQRFDRQRVWAISMALAGIAYLALGFLPPKPPLVVVTAIVATMLFCILSLGVVAPALLGDIVDYGKVKFGRDRSGLYLSVYTQVLKGAAAVASGLGLVMLGWLGFDATKAGADMTAADVQALKWVCVWIPALGMILSAPLIWRFPIDRKQQEAIAAELKAREAQATST